MRNVTIVGAGKVGSVLGRVLVENGYKVVCVVSRTKKSAKATGKFLKCRNTSESIDSIPSSTDLILITTPHSAVGQVAQELSSLTQLNFKRLSVCHASGMLSASTLEPLQKKGVTVFSFHPLQTFPRDFVPKDIVPTARGIYYAVDGTPQAVRKATALARMLEGKIIEIKPEMRAFYHAACVVASNHLTTMLSIVETMFRQFDSKEKDFFQVFKPIVMATLRNIEATSPAVALSGPIARGGVETIGVHFASIKQFSPELLPYFGTLTLETVRLAEQKGSVPPEGAEALRELVHSYSKTKETH